MARFLALFLAFMVSEALAMRGDYDHLRRAAIRIQAVTSNFDWMTPFHQGGDGVSVGSGFVVETDPMPLFVTNAHVVNNAHTLVLQLLNYGEEQFQADVVSVCPKFDLAIIRLRDSKTFLSALAEKDMKLEKLALSDKVTNMGEDVVALGFPLGQSNLKISNGVIAGNEEVDSNICIQSTAPISPGSSGGPLLNEAGTEVVGVNFAKATTGENINYVIPAWRVKQMVELHKYSEKTEDGKGRVQVKVPSIGLTTIESNEALYRMSNGCKEGVLVARVSRRSFVRNAVPPVERMSFLVSVNGVKIDKFGQGLNEQYCRDQVSYKDLFMMKANLYGNATFETCKDGKTQTHEASLDWRQDYDQGIRYVEEPAFEKIEFETFGDISVMQMTVNHISAVIENTGDPGPARWLHPDRVTEPRLVVNYVAPGSYAADFLTAGSAVDKVNGEEVRTLEDFRAAFIPKALRGKKAAAKGLGFLQDADDDAAWTLETDMGKLYAVMFKETLQGQVTAANNGAMYMMSPAVMAATEKLGMAGNPSTSTVARLMPANATTADVKAHTALLLGSQKKVAQGVTRPVVLPMGDAAAAGPLMAKQSETAEGGFHTGMRPYAEDLKI